MSFMWFYIIDEQYQIQGDIPIPKWNDNVNGENGKT